MKIALVVPGIGCSASVSTPVLNTFIRSLGREVTLHVFPVRHPIGREQFSVGGVVFHPIESSNLRLRRLVPHMLARIRGEHLRGSFDVVHGMWLFEPGAIAVAVAHLLGVPSIASIGGAEVVHLPDIGYGGMQSIRGRIILRQVLERATVVTGGSRYILDRAIEVTSRGGERLIAPLPIDASWFTPMRREALPDPDAPRLLHAASLIPVKDQHTLIEATSILKRSFPGLTLTIAGEDPFGHRASLESLVAEYELTDSIHFAGAVAHDDMAALYRETDLFLLSSRHESQGMVVLEAAACGLPTVGTAVGVIPDLAPDAAVAVPPRSPDTLANAARGLLSTPDRLRTMGANARKRAVQEYDAPVVIERFLDVYREALDRGSR